MCKYPYPDCIALKHCQNKPGNKHLHSCPFSGFSTLITHAPFLTETALILDIPAWIYHTSHYLSSLLLITYLPYCISLQKIYAYVNLKSLQYLFFPSRILGTILANYLTIVGMSIVNLS